MAGQYSKEFGYTDNHVSLYKNDIYTITLYKNGECISDLSLQIPEIDFGECYQKVKNNKQIEENLVIAIVDKKTEGSNYHKMISYSIFEPKEGVQLPIDDICKDDKIVLQESLINKINDTNINMNSILHLTGQNIDIFNLSSDFYTDICYHYDSNIDKDVALKDRVLLYYPNITLCEDSCETKGVHIETLKAICECKINNKENILSNNILYQSQIGQIEEMISNTNIGIIKCYKDIFKYKYFISSTGGFIILSLIFVQIICTIIYSWNNLYKIRKYIFMITNKYLFYLSNPNNNLPFQNNSIPSTEKAKAPPKKNKIIERQASLNETKGRKNIRRHKGKGKTTINKKIVFSVKTNDIINNYNNDTIGNNKNLNYKKINNNSGNNNVLSISKNLIDDKNKLGRNKKTKTFVSKSKKMSYEYSGNLSNTPFNNSKLSDDRNTQNTMLINLNDNLDIDINEYLITEIDDMDYDDAKKKDQRKFCVYFGDKLKSNQIILNTFFYYEPFKPRAIKIILFILQIDLYFFVNGLFYNEEYVSKIFHLEKDTFYESSQRFIGNFFYAALVGVIVNYIIVCFFIDEKKLKGILKREKENIFILKYEVVQLTKDIKKRYIFFIIISFIITILTWFHISCFNTVYPHMKKEWIIFSLLIIIFMQILSMLVCFLETILRFISFRCKSEKIYKISILLS